jgi:uncharacterized membrane protein YhaH (DUF805 family)
MAFSFAFEGQMRRPLYALSTFGVFGSQHFMTLIAFRAQGERLLLDWQFYLMPLRSLVTQTNASNLTLILALAYLLLVAWVLAALAFRRAADANLSGWIAAFAMAPIIQIPAILCLCFFPTRMADRHSESADDDGLPDWWAATAGVIVGMGFTLSAVAIGTLFFGSYGYGVFVVAPFVIGAITAYFANRKRDLGAMHTAMLVASATVLGGMALVMAALEGVICVAVASPLGVGIALVGGLLGRSIALHARHTVQQTLSVCALLPLVFTAETILPPIASFDTYATIEINAPPEVVWRSVVHMEAIDEPLALAFRLGVAYPLRGEVIGEGIGASRLGEFSTGTAVEQVMEWVPNRKLAFTVLHDVPAMRELSPYEHVHAPHVVGYFHTTYTSFELLPRENGRTEIVERTSHTLKLEPVLYWLPLARWVVQRNNARVLAHIKRQAERSLTIGG